MMSDSQPSIRYLVRDLMQVGVPSCAPTTPLAELARQFIAENLESVVVLDESGHAVGAVSRHDLLKAFIADSAGALAEDVMCDQLPQVPPDIPLTAAAQIMDDMNVRLLYIMHHAGGIAYPAAILTDSHFLRLLAATAEEELDDLGIKARREAPLQTFFRRRDEARRQSGLQHSAGSSPSEEDH